MEPISALIFWNDLGSSENLLALVVISLFGLIYFVIYGMKSHKNDIEERLTNDKFREEIPTNIDREINIKSNKSLEITPVFFNNQKTTRSHISITPKLERTKSEIETFELDQTQIENYKSIIMALREQLEKMQISLSGLLSLHSFENAIQKINPNSFILIDFVPCIPLKDQVKSLLDQIELTCTNLPCIEFDDSSHSLVLLIDDVTLGLSIRKINNIYLEDNDPEYLSFSSRLSYLLYSGIFSEFVQTLMPVYIFFNSTVEKEFSNRFSKKERQQIQDILTLAHPLINTLVRIGIQPLPFTLYCDWQELQREYRPLGVEVHPKNIVSREWRAKLESVGVKHNSIVRYQNWCVVNKHNRKLMGENQLIVYRL